VPGGTLRENMQGRPGQAFLGPDHSKAKPRGIAPTPSAIVEETDAFKEASNSQIHYCKSPSNRSCIVTNNWRIN
jgi:hypothetical protein